MSHDNFQDVEADKLVIDLARGSMKDFGSNH